MPVHPGADEHRHVQATTEPCELPDGIELVYADNRDRRHAIALKDAVSLHFGSAKPFRKPPRVPGQRNFPGWWWSATIHITEPGSRIGTGHALSHRAEQSEWNHSKTTRQGQGTSGPGLR